MQSVQSDLARPPATTAPSRWKTLNARILPLQYPLFVLACVVLVIAGQWVEDALDTAQIEMLTPGISIPRWTVVVLTLYMIVVLRLIQRTATRTIVEIRSTVACDDSTFDGLALRMKRVHWRTDLGLAVLSFAIVVILFPIFQSPLPVVRNPQTNALTYLPQDALNAAVVMGAYFLVGWCALRLFVHTVRLGKALGELTQKPLNLNVFDPSNVLPLGRLALALSLAPAGIILILLIGLGSPTGLISWSLFVLASLTSVLALILPLRGVHRQMSHEKQAALSRLNHDLSVIHAELVGAASPDAARDGVLLNRTNLLMNLRKIVQEGPTWPFQNTVAVLRAVLVAGAPLVYTVLNELIRFFVIAPITK